jgi:hypothetical protein
MYSNHLCSTKFLIVCYSFNNSFELKEGKHTLFTTEKWQDKFKRSAGSMFGKVKKSPKELRVRLDKFKLKIEGREPNGVPFDAHAFAFNMI